MQNISVIWKLIFQFMTGIVLILVIMGTGKNNLNVINVIAIPIAKASNNNNNNNNNNNINNNINNSLVLLTTTTTTTTAAASIGSNSTEMNRTNRPSDEINIIHQMDYDDGNNKLKQLHKISSTQLPVSTSTASVRNNKTKTLVALPENINTTEITKIMNRKTKVRTTTALITNSSTIADIITTIVPKTTTSVPAKLPNALLLAATTVRTYLGMQSNITLSSASSSKFQQNRNKVGGIATDIKFTLPKPQKTDAPMLNYIFDSFSTANRHHHHDQRYGPHFEDAITSGNNITNMTVQAGSTVYFNCRISLLQDKTVSWVKRKSNSNDENSLELLTVGMHTYSGDNRYTMEFQYPNNWRLKIGNVRKSDEGTYECQISTHPPRVIQVNLHVNAPKVMIVDEHGSPLQEKYYEIDSTLQLFCIVRNVVMSSSVVYWSHGDLVLNYDTTRGGVSVKTELMEDGANSTLFIARINKSDSGNYTCSINSSHEYSIMVHILNGESFAELHHGISNKINPNISTMLCLFLILFIAYKNFLIIFR